MIDSHVHLEKGNNTVEWIEKKESGCCAASAVRVPLQKFEGLYGVEEVLRIFG